MPLIIKLMKSCVDGKEFLEASRTNGFADLIIDLHSVASTSFGAEQAERFIHFDKATDGGRRTCR